MILPQGSIHKNSLQNNHRRIISLVPSISWMLFDFQLHDHICAITKFCKALDNRDSGFKRIGGTKNPDIYKINQLKPDLILANKEENRKEDIEELAKNHLVYLSDIKDLESMYEMIYEVGRLTGVMNLSFDFINQIKTKHREFVFGSENLKKIPVAYLIWKNPLMTIGSDTFIHYMLELAGFENIFSERTRYPIITQDELLARNPAFIFLSSEPYPFTQKHFKEFKSLDPRLVDGRMFSWYGTFILQSFEYLNALKKSLNSSI